MFYFYTYSLYISLSPFRCIVHHLHRYYTDAWIKEVPNRQDPHMDGEISEMTNKMLQEVFLLVKIKQQLDDFSFLEMNSIPLAQLRIELIWRQRNGGEFMATLLHS
jgi:hypothetical protein